MTDSSQIATSLLTEHLRYTPLSLIDDIINSINNLVYQGITSLENGLNNTAPERLGFKPSATLDDEGNPTYPDAKLEIENGLHQLETLLESTVDKNFDKLEIYLLRNILTVPEDLAGWIRLSHYEGLAFDRSDSATAPTPESIALQRRKLQESQKLRHALLQETARNEVIVAQLQSMSSPPSLQTETDALQTPNFSFLKSAPAAEALNVGKANNTNPLTTNATFTISQLPALRSMLAALRPKLQSLNTLAVSVDEDSKKEQRRRYIEERTRLQVDKFGGDMEALKGRKVDAEEVEALEKVSGMFERD